MAKQFTYGKTEKLKSRKVIDSLFKSGNSFTVYPVKVLYKVEPSMEGNLQAGVAVSARLFKKAVDRNRIKRLLREGYRTQKKDLDESVKLNKLTLYVFFIYLDKNKTTFPVISQTMNKCLERLLQKLHNERPA